MISADTATLATPISENPRTKNTLVKPRKTESMNFQPIKNWKAVEFTLFAVRLDRFALRGKAMNAQCATMMPVKVAESKKYRSNFYADASGMKFTTGAERDYAILPRRKAGQPLPSGERAPVLLTKSILSNYFGMPLSAAAKELVQPCLKFYPIRSLLTCRFLQGICATAIKKACR